MDISHGFGTDSYLAGGQMLSEFNFSEISFSYCLEESISSYVWLFGCSTSSGPTVAGCGSCADDRIVILRSEQDEKADLLEAANIRS